MPKNHDIIEISGQLFNETDAAFLFCDGTVKKDEYGNEFPVKVWIPKSICEWTAEKAAKKSVMGIMQMPEWLALEKGFI